MSKELVKRLRRSALPSEYRKRNPDLSDAAMSVGHTYHGLMLTEAADLIERQAQIIDGLERLVIDAYVRGVEWCEENPVDREYRFKAARDYADYEIHARALTKQ